MVPSGRNEKGLTLIEMVVVLGVITILAGAFGTSLMRWLPNYRFSNYVVNLQGAIQNARLTAVKNNADVFIQLDKVNGEHRVYLDDISDAVNRGSLDSGDTLIDTAPTPQEVTYMTASLSQFTLDARGFASTSGGIYLKNSKNTYRGVTLTLAGNSRIIKSSDGTTWQ